MPHADWTSPAQVDAFLAARGSGILFKHSSQCSVSASVRERAWEPFLAAHPQIPVYEVLVIEARAASNRIADALGIAHQSPQAIVVKDGEATWMASHLGITAAALAEAWG